MQKTMKFLKEAKVFWLVTNNGLYPSARPFGVAMPWKDRIYLCTNRNKNVYKQIIANRHVCLVSLMPKTRTWIRLNCDAKISHDISLKKRMWNLFPILAKRYNSFNNEDFQLIEVQIKNKELHLD